MVLFSYKLILELSILIYLYVKILIVIFVVLITVSFTNVKNGAGRPRLDFFGWCFPKGRQLYDQVS